ncbi:Os01g0633500, partial [Oryza sativa Japonica Group]
RWEDEAVAGAGGVEGEADAVEGRPGRGRQLRRGDQGLHGRVPRRDAHGLRVRGPGERGGQAHRGRDAEHHAGLQGRRHRQAHRLHLLRRDRQHRGAAAPLLRPRRLERHRLLPPRQDDRMDVLRVQVIGGEGRHGIREGARAGPHQRHPHARRRALHQQRDAAEPRHRAGAAHGERGPLLDPEAGAVRPPRRPLRRRDLPLREPRGARPLRLLLPRRHHPRPRDDARGHVPGVRRAAELSRDRRRPPPAGALLVVEAPRPRVQVQVHAGGHVRGRRPDVQGEGASPAAAATADDGRGRRRRLGGCGRREGTDTGEGDRDGGWC